MSIDSEYEEYCQNLAPTPTPPTSEQSAGSLYILEVLAVKRDTDKALLVKVKAGLFWVPKSISYLAKDKKSIALESWFEVKIQEEEAK